MATFGDVSERSFRAAALQFRATGDKARNLDALESFTEVAAAQGAELVVAPEVFLWRGPQEQEPAVAEPVPGPVPDRLASIARRFRVHLVAGSLLELATDARCSNTSLAYAPDGTQPAAYRALPLFDVDLGSTLSIRESDTRLGGDTAVSFACSLGRIGLGICYDLRFPELFRRLAQAEATVVAVPSAFTFNTGSAHWEVLLRARAIENQCYVVAANQYGEGMGGIVNYGHSMIVDPWGTVVARTGGDRDDVVVATIDGSYLERVRAQLPALQHKRLDTGDR